MNDLQISSVYPNVRGRRVKVKYMVQVCIKTILLIALVILFCWAQAKTRPPTFVLFSSHHSVPDHHVNFMRLVFFELSCRYCIYRECQPEYVCFGGLDQFHLQH
jgi:hypothetical protein